MFLKDKDFLYTTFRGMRYLLPHFFRKSDGAPVLLEGEKGVFTQLAGKNTKTEKTHSSTTPIPANSWSQGSWLKTEGADKIVVTVAMSGGTGMTVAVDFSHDATTQAMSSTVYDNTGSAIGIEQSVFAEYFRISIKNKDANSPKPTNAWAYFKY